MHRVSSGCALREPSCNLQKLYYIQRKKIFQDLFNICPTYTHLSRTAEGEMRKNPLPISILFKILILAFQHISNNLESVKRKIKGAFYLARNKVKLNDF